LRSGELRAIDAVCPHSGGPLADGQFDVKKVICALHNYFFSMADGTCLNGDYAVRSYPVRVAEFFYDDEARNWHYRIPALHINGGGVTSREQAVSQCLAAIAFALEGDPHEYDSKAETVTFDVSVSPAA
jgi:hypothetical protein